MPVTEHRLIAFDQTPLFYRKVVPVLPTKALVFLVHGMGEYGGRYTEFAEYLASCGIECWLPDLRGFGNSGGKRGCVRHLSDYENDLEALGTLAERTHRGLPLFLMGHSFGGLLASRLLEETRVLRPKGLILSSPLFGIAIAVPFWQKILAALASFLAPNFTQNNRVQVDLLTHDHAKRLSHARDKLIHFEVSARLYTQMQKGMSQGLEMAERIHCPALVLQAGDDKIVSREKTTLFYERLGSLDKEFQVYQDFYHEVLNESERAKVYARIQQWLLKHI